MRNPLRARRHRPTPLPMQRVMVIGGPGAGKSTFARALADATGLPLIHLDQVYFQPGWVEPDDADFAAEVRRIAAGARWIIDGNHTRLIADRLTRADTLIWLDVPVWRRLPRVVWRTVTSRGQVRPDMAEGCPERFDWQFLLWTAGWKNDTDAKARDAIAAAPAAVTSHTLRTPAEIERFLTLARGGSGPDSRTP